MPLRDRDISSSLSKSENREPSGLLYHGGNLTPYPPRHYQQPTYRQAPLIRDGPQYHAGDRTRNTRYVPSGSGPAQTDIRQFGYREIRRIDLSSPAPSRMPQTASTLQRSAYEKLYLPMPPEAVNTSSYVSAIEADEHDLEVRAQQVTRTSLPKRVAAPMIQRPTPVYGTVSLNGDPVAWPSSYQPSKQAVQQLLALNLAGLSTRQRNGARPAGAPSTSMRLMLASPSTRSDASGQENSPEDTEVQAPVRRNNEPYPAENDPNEMTKLQAQPTLMAKMAKPRSTPSNMKMAPQLPSPPLSNIGRREANRSMITISSYLTQGLPQGVGDRQIDSQKRKTRSKDGLGLREKAKHRREDINTASVSMEQDDQKETKPHPYSATNEHDNLDDEINELDCTALDAFERDEAHMYLRCSNTLATRYEGPLGPKITPADRLQALGTNSPKEGSAHLKVQTLAEWTARHRFKIRQSTENAVGLNTHEQFSRLFRLFRYYTLERSQQLPFLLAGMRLSDGDEYPASTSWTVDNPGERHAFLGMWGSITSTTRVALLCVPTVDEAQHIKDIAPVTGGKKTGRLFPKVTHLTMAAGCWYELSQMIEEVDTKTFEEYVRNLSRLADPVHLCLDYGISIVHNTKLRGMFRILRNAWTKLKYIHVHQALDDPPYIMPGVAYVAQYRIDSAPRCARGFSWRRSTEHLPEVDELESDDGLEQIDDFNDAHLDMTPDVSATNGRVAIEGWFDDIRTMLDFAASAEEVGRHGGTTWQLEMPKVGSTEQSTIKEEEQHLVKQFAGRDEQSHWKTQKDSDGQLALPALDIRFRTKRTYSCGGCQWKCAEELIHQSSPMIKKDV